MRKRKDYETGLTAERLQSDFDFDAETGLFRRKFYVGSRGRMCGGFAVGTVTFYGYLVVRIDGFTYRLNRLAWLYYYREWPPFGKFVDHLNLNRTDNRIANLRLATNSENMRNRDVPKNNTSGIKGVWFHGQLKKWIAEIKIDYKKIHLGVFVEKEDARKARIKAEEKYFKNFARTS